MKLSNIYYIKMKQKDKVNKAPEILSSDPVIHLYNTSEGSHAPNGVRCNYV